jgi:hypothetical protein
LGEKLKLLAWIAIALPPPLIGAAEWTLTPAAHPARATITTGTTNKDFFELGGLI